jgi:hypothetical protein
MAGYVQNVCKAVDLYVACSRLWDGPVFGRVRFAEGLSVLRHSPLTNVFQIRD